MSDLENPGRVSQDALDRALTSLYRAEPPESFDNRWRAAIRQEECVQMKTHTVPRQGKRLWRMALPMAATLVLVAGTLMTGAGLFDPQPHRLPDSQPQTERKAVLEDAIDYEWGSWDYAADDGLALGAAPSNERGTLAGAIENQDRKIVRTAYLTIATSTLDADAGALRTLTESAGGYVEAMNQYESTGSRPRQTSFDLRVPTEKLDAFLADAAAIGRVTSRSESASDQTVTYRDTELRLATQRAKMTRLQELLVQANDVSDLLAIETEIANTQYTLDSYETSLRNIDRQVDESYVSITLTEETPGESAAAEDMALGERLRRAWQASLAGIQTFFRNMLVFLTMALPVALPLVAIGLIAWLIWRRRNARRESPDMQPQIIEPEKEE